MDDYRLDREAAALETLRLALEAIDRTEEAREALAKHGTTYVDRFQSAALSVWRGLGGQFGTTRTTCPSSGPAA